MKEYLKEILNRLKSPVVLSGLIPIIIIASGISPENMTSWSVLGDNIVAVLLNPFILGSIVWQIGVYLNNPADKEKF